MHWQTNETTPETISPLKTSKAETIGSLKTKSSFTHTHVYADMFLFLHYTYLDI